MTSKELAELLGLSQTAVSFALNGKPGVSTATRNRVLEAAEKYGIDAQSLRQRNADGTVYLIYYKKHGAVLGDTSFFAELTEGVEHSCTGYGYKVNILNIYEDKELERRLEDMRVNDASGVILFGTEMQQEDFGILAMADIPIVLLDNHFLSAKIDSVKINNREGAYSAANYLIHKLKVQPGYLHSSYSIINFEERREGFLNALRHNGMPQSGSVIHELTPSMNGAYSDMCRILETSGGEKPARCYFADNDLIALGAMRAFREHGYSIPGDISIIGFDDIPMCDYTDPGLSTVHVPKQYMGICAVNRLHEIIHTRDHYPVNIEVSTHLVLRGSV